MGDQLGQQTGVNLEIVDFQLRIRNLPWMSTSLVLTLAAIDFPPY